MKLRENIILIISTTFIICFFIIGGIRYALKYKKLVKECLKCKKLHHPDCTNDCKRNPNGIHDNFYPQLSKCIIRTCITKEEREELKRLIDELD